ncbi:hypothetical protein F5Y13DRAFT_192275 [Hypoxylon sp. FL1857]|nr:hypothetical protein F5Y13DRAFT_192275 [Hypoxylon sp. FL1857]
MHRPSNSKNSRHFYSRAALNPSRPPPPTVPEPPNVTKDQIGCPKITRGDLSTDKDPYAFLRPYYTTFIIDDSVSMSKHWLQLGALFEKLSPFFSNAYPRGISLDFLNHGRYTLSNNDNGGNNAIDIFRRVKPNSQCRLGYKLKHVLKGYIREYVLCLRRKNPKGIIYPLNVIVITAGDIDDDIVQPLMWSAIGLDVLRTPLYQVSVQFFHVEDRDVWELTRLYEMVEKYNLRAMVNTALCGPLGGWSAELILKTTRNFIDASVKAEEDRTDESENDTDYDVDEGCFPSPFLEPRPFDELIRTGAVEF